MTSDGSAHPADVIVYATGFQASDFLVPMKVTGRGNRDLHQSWAGDARAFNGITVPGFPNLSLMYGLDTAPEAHDRYNRWIDAGNAGMAWGIESARNWYKNRTGRISQNWPYSLLEFWQCTRRPDPADHLFL